MGATSHRSVFGQHLRQELDRQRISIRHLARVMAPGNPEPMRRNIARWIGGYNEPSRLHRIAIAEALGLPTEAFAADDDEEPHPVASHHEMLAALALALEPFHPSRQLVGK